MVDYRLIHKLDGYITLILSFLLNSILIILLFTKSPKILKPYIKLILLSICFDLLFTITLFFIELEIEISDGKFFFVLDGITAFTPQPLAFILIVYYWFSFLYVCIFNRPVIYLYRYFVICKNKTINCASIILLYLAVFIVALSAMILPILALSQNIYAKKFANLLLFDDRDWTINGVLPSFVVANSLESIVTYMFGYIGILIVISYVITCYLSWKIYKKLSSLNVINIKKIQNQISFVLSIQAIIPILVTSVPLTVMMTIMVSEGHVPDIGSLILFMSFSWIPILNPLMTILFISSFRKAIMDWLIYGISCFKITGDVQTITVVSKNQTLPRMYHK